MNATLLNAPRALAAATAALALALVVALIAPAIAGDLSRRLDQRSSAPASTTGQAVVLPATWAHAPLASPLEQLRK